MARTKTKPVKDLDKDLYDSPLHKNWRPGMAWLYMAICAFDFMIAPIFYSVLLAITSQPIVQWDPLTLQGGGLFHAAMAAIVGVSAWSRGREKLGLLDYSMKIKEMEKDKSTE